MSGLVDKFKRMWDVPDDDYDEYEESHYDNLEGGDDDYSSKHHESSFRSSSVSSSFFGGNKNNKVVNINATARLQVVLFKPETFGTETKSIADELIRSHTVVLNLENTNRDQSRRILDFLSGCAYANNGSVKRIATSTYLIIPNNVELTGDELLDELESSGLYF